MPTLRQLTSAFAFALVVSGCVFDPPGPAEPEEDIITVPPGAEPVPRPCSAEHSSDLVLCLDFEDDSLASKALDGSPLHLDAVATAVSSLDRITGERAALLTNASSLHIPESAGLDVAAFTIEMWIQRGPAGPRKDATYGLFENFGQYSMQIEADGDMLCGVVGSARVKGSARVTAGEWAHVACRFSGGEMRVYVNGWLAGCETSLNPAVPTIGIIGSTVGSRFAAPSPGYRDRFIGGIDNVRVYKAPLTEEQICASAGQAPGTCNTACPSGHGEEPDGD